VPRATVPVPIHIYDESRPWLVCGAAPDPGSEGPTVFTLKALQAKAAARARAATAQRAAVQRAREREQVGRWLILMRLRASLTEIHLQFHSLPAANEPCAPSRPCWVAVGGGSTGRHRPRRTSEARVLPQVSRHQPRHGWWGRHSYSLRAPRIITTQRSPCWSPMGCCAVLCCGWQQDWAVVARRGQRQTTPGRRRQARPHHGQLLATATATATAPRRSAPPRHHIMAPRVDGGRGGQMARARTSAP
jgi:hypothetical protein